MTPDLQQGFRVGPWLIEPLKGSITGPDGKRRHLQPKVMDVFVILASNAKQPVTREALLGEVWGEFAFSDELLTRAIGELRRALEDDRSHPTYIETIPKRGYRLIQPSVLLDDPQAAESALVGMARAVGRLINRRALLASTIGLALLILVFIVTIRIKGPSSPDSASVVIDAPPNSIAVMPFSACTDDDESRLLAASIAQEVRRKLAQVKGIPVAYRPAGYISVIARSSSHVFWEAGMSPDMISKQLRVRFVLIANICETNGTLATDVSLIGADGYIVESAFFEQGQNEQGLVNVTLSQIIADAVGTWLGATPDQSQPALVRIEAREQLLIAREHVALGDRENAAAALESALLVQPDYPEAIFEQALLELNGLDLNQRQGFENALQRAEEAKQVALLHFLSQPQSYETNLIVGRILAAIASWQQNLSWRIDDTLDSDEILAVYREAENYLRAATRLAPSSAFAAGVLADVVDAQDRKNEALQILEQSLVHDPFNPDLTWRIALGWAARGRYEDAIELLQRFNHPVVTSYRTWNWQLELMQIHGYWADQGEALVTLLNSYPEIAAHQQIRFQMSWFIGDLLHLGLRDEAEAWRARLSVADLPEWGQLYRDRFYYWGLGDQQELTRRTRERLAAMTEDQPLDSWANLPMNWAWDLAAGGDLEGAILLMERLQHAPALYNERDTLPSFLLAKLYIRDGRRADAEPILDRLRDHLELEVASGIVHPESLFRLSEVYALQGLNESAINALQLAVNNHWRMPWWRLPWNTTLNGLDSDPRVVSLRVQVEADLNEQANRIRDLLAQHDADELLAPVAVVAR
jgi:DNA-binding winged helix-turn-helix (wHTH) protein/TolB-like protein/tetratricopeptide (TPR) repeat protein